MKIWILILSFQLFQASKTKKYFHKLPDGSYVLNIPKDGKKYKPPNASGPGGGQLPPYSPPP